MLIVWNLRSKSVNLWLASLLSMQFISSNFPDLLCQIFFASTRLRQLNSYHSLWIKQPFFGASSQCAWKSFSPCFIRCVTPTHCPPLLSFHWSSWYYCFDASIPISDRCILHVWSFFKQSWRRYFIIDGFQPWIAFDNRPMIVLTFSVSYISFEITFFFIFYNECSISCDQYFNLTSSLPVNLPEILLAIPRVELVNLHYWNWTVAQYSIHCVLPYTMSSGRMNCLILAFMACHNYGWPLIFVG